MSNYDIWKRLTAYPGGRWLFSTALCVKAPYFASIGPTLEELEPGRCVVRVPKRRKVLNHLSTVHAIACCNAAELAGGMSLDAAVPQTHRWIPRGMTVEYRAKATTSLRAVASFPVPTRFGDTPFDLVVPVDIHDEHGSVVVHAEITMNVSRKPVVSTTQGRTVP